MNNIYFFLTTYDSIKFIIPDKMTTFSILPYKKFIVYLKENFKINDYPVFEKELNTYGNTILLDGSKGSWVVRNEDYSEENINLPFESLYKLNKKEEKQKSRLEQFIDSGKKFIQRVYKDE